MKKFLKYFLLFFGIIFFSSCSVENNESKGGVNTLPMYGEAEKTEAQKKCDEKFIKDTIESAGSREKAVEVVMKRAWVLFSENDLDTSMKRFNQVWLLDSDNPEVFFGFGVIMGKNKDWDESIKFLNEGIKLSPNDEMYGEISYKIGVAYYHKAMNSEDFNVRLVFLKKATDYYEKAILKNSEISYYYADWAYTLYELGEYEKSLEKLNRAKKLGMKVEKFEKEILKKLE